MRFFLLALALLSLPAPLLAQDYLSQPVRVELYQQCIPERKVADLNAVFTPPGGSAPVVQRPTVGLTSCEQPAASLPQPALTLAVTEASAGQLRLVGAIAEAPVANPAGEPLFRAVVLTHPADRPSEHTLGEGQWRYRLVLTPQR